MLRKTDALCSERRYKKVTKMNEAKDSAIEAIKDVTTTVSKYITFNANKTNFFIKLRKNLDVRFPGKLYVYIYFEFDFDYDFDDFDYDFDDDVLPNTNLSFYYYITFIFN